MAVSDGRIHEDTTPAPDLPAGLHEWVAAFWELSTDRQIGMAVGPVPAASIDRWVSLHYPREESRFRGAIRAMDSVYLGEVRNNDPGKPKVSSRPLTADIFDSLFTNPINRASSNA